MTSDVPSGSVGDFAHVGLVRHALPGDLAALRAHRAGRRQQRDPGPGASLPPNSHLPLALFAAVHYLLLDGLDHPLAEVYAGRSDADPAPLFIEVCRTHWDEIESVLATRHVQTNDCGRSALIGPGLTWLAARLPRSSGTGRRGCQRRPLPPVRPLPSRLRRPRRDRTGGLDGRGQVPRGRRRPADRRTTARPRSADRNRPVAARPRPDRRTPDGCWPASGPTRAGSDARRRPSGWRRTASPNWSAGTPTRFFPASWPACPTEPLPSS